MKFGLHTRPQWLAFEDLKRAWKRVDEGGFSWVSVSDRFYANPLIDRTTLCFEALTTMTALAATTENVKVGCLMFSCPVRAPGLLAKAIATIDHISGGRAQLGLGASFEEYLFELREFGYDVPSAQERRSMLEEYVQVIGSLFREDVTNFAGRYYKLNGAVCSPKPLRNDIPIWMGSPNIRHMPRLAAKYADGYNVPFVSPADYRMHMEALDRQCEELGRDPKQITRSVQLNFYMGADEATAARHRSELDQFEIRNAGYLVGTQQEVIDTLDRYRRAGVDIANICFRRHIDWDALDAMIEDVVPAFS